MVSHHLSLLVIGIMVYLSGLPFCYYTFRTVIKGMKDDPYVLGDKFLIIYLSLGSWLAFSLFLLFSFLTSTEVIDPDKECKW